MSLLLAKTDIISLDMAIQIRAYNHSDKAFFRSMFYESLFVPPGADPFPLSLIDEPHLAKYHLDWGREGDLCHIALMKEIKVGAIWSRYFTSNNPGYGYVSDDIPEFGIATHSDWRAMGIGSALIERHFTALRAAEKCSGVSLSADLRNRAVRLYERTGFQEVSREGDSVVMVLGF